MASVRPEYGFSAQRKIKSVLNWVRCDIMYDTIRKWDIVIVTDHSEWLPNMWCARTHTHTHHQCKWINITKYMDYFGAPALRSRYKVLYAEREPAIQSDA